MREKKGIENARDKYFDLIWYSRHQVLEEREKAGALKTDPEIWAGALKAAKRIEKKYPKKMLQGQIDLEWGIMLGKFAALRWVLGDDWDNFSS